jgi:hypothetical protein
MILVFDFKNLNLLNYWSDNYELQNCTSAVNC